MTDTITLTLMVLGAAFISGLGAFVIGMFTGLYSRFIFRSTYLHFLQERMAATEELIQQQRQQVEHQLNEQIAKANADVSQVYRDALSVKEKSEDQSSPSGTIMN